MTARQLLTICIRNLAFAFVALGANAAFAGVVYTSTNDPAGNRVRVYHQAGNGHLIPLYSAATGGAGTGTGLGNQGAVTLSDNGRWLLVTNAGSDEVSVFRAVGPLLLLTDVEPSGGDMPVSVTISDRLVYVLNAAGAGSIAGFELTPTGQLSRIAGSVRPLSGAATTAPAQVQFNPQGDKLVVTEKDTNIIDVYEVGADGLASAPDPQPSQGMTPFGFGFTSEGYLIVSEAFGGAPDASAVSSYDLTDTGELDVISPSVPTTETAACWIAITDNDRFAYTTNTGSGTITGYRISDSGNLMILDADGVTATTGAGTAPTDLALSRYSRFLLALNSATGEVAVFRVNANGNGNLMPVQTVGGLPPNATGLAVR
jgi:6-phosphogluconolactonase